MTKINLKQKADEIVARLAPNPWASWASWERMRDYIDLKTGNDLDPIQLDILTDMVLRRMGAFGPQSIEQEG